MPHSLLVLMASAMVGGAAQVRCEAGFLTGALDGPWLTNGFANGSAMPDWTMSDLNASAGPVCTRNLLFRPEALKEWVTCKGVDSAEWCAAVFGGFTCNTSSLSRWSTCQADSAGGLSGAWLTVEIHFNPDWGLWDNPVCFYWERESVSAPLLLEKHWFGFAMFDCPETLAEARNSSSFSENISLTCAGDCLSFGCDCLVATTATTTFTTATATATTGTVTTITATKTATTTSTVTMAEPEVETNSAASLAQLGVASVLGALLVW